MIFESARLRYTPLVEDDFPFIVAFQTNAELMRYITGRARSVGEVQDSMRAMCACWRTRGFGFFLVRLRDGNRPIGYAGLKPMKEPAYEVEIGYLIEKPSSGQGYATEAAAAIARWAFEVFLMPRLFAVVDREHLPSQKVARNIGMTLTGRTPAFAPSCQLYEMSAEQWDARSVPPTPL